MNKKFSTLVATLLVSGALFTLNAEPKSLDAIKDLPGIEWAADNSGMKLTEDVVLEDQKSFLLIDKDNFVLDGNGKTMKGHIVITGKNVTVKNLTIDYKNVFAQGEDGTVAVNKTAITVIADGVTLEGNTIKGSTDHFLVNGITIFPTGTEGKIVVKNNTIKKANGVVGETFSTGFQIAGDYALSGTGCTSVTGTNKTVADLSKLQLTASGNKYEECTTDLSYTTGWSDTEASKQGVVIASQVTPMIGEDGSITNAGAIKGAVNKAAEGASIVFNGTAEQLTDALGEGVTVNVAVKTNDGIVVSSVAQLDAKIKGYDLVANVSDKVSFETSEYYLLVVKGDDGKSYAVTADENGKPTCVEINVLTSQQATSKSNLWKMKQTLDDDHKYTFTFTNKAGKKLTVGDADFFQSVANAPYGVGVAFELNGLNLDQQNATPHYFGLYKSATHPLTAKDLYFIEKTGFTVTIENGKLAGDPITGNRLAPMTWNSTTKTFDVADDNATTYSLKNVDGNYIVAKRTNAEGEATNQDVYAFTTISEADLLKERALATDKRTIFDVFTAYHKPVSANDNLEMLTNIDSMTVQVLNADKKLQNAPVGYFKLTTDGTKTLGASIEYKLFPISIQIGNNVVDPKDFLKDAFFKVTLLQEEKDGGDVILAVNGCATSDADDAKAWVTSVGNELEAQWVVTYDEEKAEYTAVNRENPNVKFTVKKNVLRENDDKEDNIYTDGENLYKIEAIAADKSENYYKYLGDVENQRLHMAHHSGVYNQNAWFTTDEDGYVIVNIDEEKAVEIRAINAETKADTAKVESTVGFYNKDGKYTKKEYTLKVPVYKFSVKGTELGLSNGKYQFDANADVFAIRKDGDYWNLRTVTVEDGVATMDCAKVYASTSDETAGYLKKVNGLYTETTNDWFVVEELNRPIYRRLGTTIAEDGFTGNVDTAKFYRTNEVTGYYLYENSMNRNTQGGKPSLNFLGETHLNDLPATAALPILIDTAYVRNNTTKPLYLLAVRDEAFVEGTPFKPCDATGSHKHLTVDGKPTDKAEECFHATPATPGYRKAHYLVALNDSVYPGNEDMVKYKEKTRLAFVPATHFENDTLVIESSIFTNKKKEASKDSLSFVDKDGEQVMNAATFAFRMVDPADTETGDFYIETEVNGDTKYVHVLNTVPVLVDHLEDAAPFNIEDAEGEKATANDEIAAEGVKVIATEGAVIVKGAEGKNVVITNVLGQTIANTVVTSDEATIAAPAGVVVVAVEGEAAVKAIVK